MFWENILELCCFFEIKSLPNVIDKIFSVKDHRERERGGGDVTADQFSKNPLVVCAAFEIYRIGLHEIH